MPASQASHTKPVCALEYRPATQASQLEAPDDEALPLGQAVQAEALVLEKVPASHGAHELLPTASLYLPGSQLWHASARVPEYVPAGQVEQFTDRAAAYVPASHDSQAVAPVFAPVAEPALQSRQASSSAVGAYVPVGQASHEVSLKAYSPALQARASRRSVE